MRRPKEGEVIEEALNEETPDKESEELKDDEDLKSKLEDPEVTQMI